MLRCSWKMIENTVLRWYQSMKKQERKKNTVDRIQGEMTLLGKLWEYMGKREAEHMTEGEERELGGTAGGEQMKRFWVVKDIKEELQGIE